MSHQKDDSHDWLGDAAENYVRYCFARDGFEVFGSGKWAADLIVRNTDLDEEKWWRVEVKGGHHEYIIWQFGIIHNGILY